MRSTGWRVVSVGVAVQLLHFGLFQQAFSVYLPVLTGELGWSFAALGAVYALHQATAGAIGPMQGWAIVRFGARRVAAVGTVLLAAALVGLSTSGSLPTFAAWFVVGAVGQSLSGFLTLISTVVSWFGRASAWPLSIMQVGLSLGGLLAPALALAVTAYGWRGVMLVSGAIVLLIGLPLSLSLTAGPSAPSASATDPDGSASAYRRSLRTADFWLLAAAHALALAVVQSINVYAVLHLTQRGSSLTSAASVLAVMTVTMIIGQLAGGHLAGRWPTRWLAASCMALHALAVFLLAVGPVALAFAMLHGLAWGVRGPLMQSMRVEYFGAEAFPRVMGASLFVATIGAVLGPLLVGVGAERSGSFQGPFFGLVLVAAVAGVGFALTGRSRAVTT